MQFFSEKTKNGNIGVSTVSQGIADFQASQMDAFLNHQCENCWGCYGCIGCVNCIDCTTCGGCDNLVGQVNAKSINGLEVAAKHADVVKYANRGKVLSLATSFFDRSIPPSYGVPEGLQIEMLIPHHWLLIKVSPLKNFKEAGPTKLLNSVIEELKQEGYLSDVDPDTVKSRFSYRGKVYLFNPYPKG